MEGSKIDFAKIPQTAMKVLTSPPEFSGKCPKPESSSNPQYL